MKKRIYLYVKEPFKSKYQLLINRREKISITELKHTKTFIDFSQTIDDIYENLKNYNQTKRIKLLIVLCDSRYGSQLKIKSYSHEIVLKRKKTLTFTFLYQNPFSNYKIKRNTLFHHKNTTQKRTSINIIESLIWYWV